MPTKTSRWPACSVESAVKSLGHTSDHAARCGRADEPCVTWMEATGADSGACHTRSLVTGSTAVSDAVDPRGSPITAYSATPSSCTGTSSSRSDAPAPPIAYGSFSVKYGDTTCPMVRFHSSSPVAVDMARTLKSLRPTQSSVRSSGSTPGAGRSHMGRGRSPISRRTSPVLMSTPSSCDSLRPTNCRSLTVKGALSTRSCAEYGSFCMPLSVKNAIAPSRSATSSGSPGGRLPPSPPSKASNSLEYAA
mmetsp:Transcript_3281/g.11891  ORF Transcript_3281/g.11891 Transcript_3281/m.11891 type:complete len:249 (+) Transcript_3281:416-1162(+)